MANWLSGLLGGIGKLFGGGGGGQAMTGVRQGLGTTLNTTGNSGGGNFLGGLSNLFGGGQGLAGLGMMGLGAMVPNAPAPKMPSQFTDYMAMLNQGGSPGMQSANQYYQGVLSGQNRLPYDAAEDTLAQEFEKQEKELRDLYRTLRPGTDPTSDSTYQRDLLEMQKNQTKTKALAMAGVQQGAASGAGALGSNLAQMMGGGAQNYLDLANAQWANAQNKRNLMSSGLMGLGSQMWSMPFQYNMMKQMFGGRG